ncbi:MAG TPA: hypothetical protein PKH80_06205 [Methanofastidiosum sp.]|nr:hypothetical protein [Methanofastidiosum sp.]HNU61031.1 hypothetical protein [Methanofastidiosum sp.]
MIYEILIGAIVLIAILFVLYFFYSPKKEGIPKVPAKKPISRENVPSVPYYSEGEVIVEDELFGMKMIWDAYEDRVENFIKFLESSRGVQDPKVISTFQEIEGDYVKMKKRLQPFLRDHMVKRMDERILYARELINKKFRY